MPHPGRGRFARPRRVPLAPGRNLPIVCPFCAIAAGTTNAHIVFSDAGSIAFLDHRPLFPGHALLIPREHHVTLADLPHTFVGPFFTGAQVLARGVQAAMNADGTFVACNNVVSQSVAHFHLHVVPRRRKDGLRGFFWPRRSYPDAVAMDAVAEAIRTSIREITRKDGGGR
jgi:histidine triad (HIT) family protein